ncbi:MAG: hypothetical protein U0031_10695 [Thermomicrobiales bacterium]
MSRTFAAGTAALCYKLFFAKVREHVLASDLLDAKTLDAAAAPLKDPFYWTRCWTKTAS